MVRAMKRYAAVAAMWGVALGLLAYRYGMLPFMWTSGWKHILPGIAIGLAVAGQQLLRQPDETRRERPALPLLIAIGAAGALLAFGLSYLAFPTLDRISIEKREFPGFSIALPSGDVHEDRGDYSTGKLALKNAGGVKGVVIVAWEPGTGMTGDELKVVGELMVKTLDQSATATMTKVAGPDGKPVETVMFRGDAALAMSVLTCGKRNVVIATGGSDPAMGLHGRVIASFVCKPDPTQDAAAKMTFPLVIDLPGWYVSENEPDQIQITDGQNALVLRAQDRDLNVDIGVIVEPMFKAAGVDGKITSRQGDRVNLTMSEGQESMDGWVRLVKCPTASAFVMALGTSQDNLDFLYDRVTKARCLRDGESAQQWPSPPATGP